MSELNVVVFFIRTERGLAANKQVNNLFVVKQLIELKSMACITASLHLEHGSVYYSELYSKSHVIGQVSTLNKQRIHLEAQCYVRVYAAQRATVAAN
jgi:hypothetical protein